MRQRIIKNIILIILVAVIALLLDHIFAPKYLDENQDGRITREFYNEKTQLDVIGLGSSTMYNAMTPVYLWGEYGFTGYVRSNASQTMWQSYYLLVDALRTGHKPSLVALDVSFMKYGEEFVEEPSNRKSIESMRDPLAKWQAVQASKYEEEQPLSYFFPVLRYHSRWKELTGDDVKYAFEQPDVTYNGFLMEFKIPEEQTIFPRESSEDAAFPEKSKDYLDRIIKLCREKNIDLLLMKTPTYQNSWYYEYDELMEGIAEENGLTYINFDSLAEAMGIDVRTDYIDDGEHFNVVGAEKFCKVFGQYIKDNYDLPDHRTDGEISSVWNGKLDAYNAAKADGMGEYKEAIENMD